MGAGKHVKTPTLMPSLKSAPAFRRLLETLPLCAHTCDRQGLITYFNPYAAQFWGRTPKLNDAMDRFCGSFKLFSPAGAPIDHDQCVMARVLKTEKAHHGEEVVMERPDGQRFTVLAYADPLRNEAGALIGAINVFIDITVRKRAEDQLKEADCRKDQFLATLAHELRNPLAPLRNGLEILKQADGNDMLIGPTLSMMERQMEQMVRLVDELLDISRITRNQLVLHKEPVELAAVIQSAQESSRPFIDAMGHELTVSLPQTSLYLEADLTYLAQVFTNLLNNAAKYSRQGSRIELSAERQGREVAVRVQDTGIGISADMLSKIFEMFVQADNASGRPQEGLGMGLTLAKQLVEMHGGTVEAYSAGLGKGSEFIVRLPLLA